MLRGIWRLTWLEIKIFVREPLGLIGSVVVPVLIFVVGARVLGPWSRAASAKVPRFASADLPIFASVLIAASAVLSLVTIVAIYREGGILKWLRATPLRPHTILSAQVLVKLLSSAVTLALMIAAGRRYYPVDATVPLASFALALLLSTASILSLGFLVASIVPTARFAQPVATLIVYPLIAISGLFMPVASLPGPVQLVSRAFPFPYAVSLMRGIWHGEGWMAHAGDVVGVIVSGAALVVISARVFRWE